MYFGQEKSADISGTKKVGDIVEKILKRHMNANPPVDFVMMMQLENNFLIEESSRTVIDFEKIYPNTQIGDIAYATCYLESESESDTIFFCDFSSDTVMFLNGEEIGRTIDCDEALGDVRKICATLNTWKMPRSYPRGHAFPALQVL